MANDCNLPDPYPRAHPRLRELTFNALGWLHRTTEAIGHPRFDESARRTQFYIDRVLVAAKTPGERKFATAISAALEGIIESDGDANGLLSQWATDVDPGVVVEFDQDVTEEG